VAVDDATALIEQLTERPRLAVVEVDWAAN
jgi:hypothetical protein